MSLCTCWATGLALIALLGLAVRLVYILGFRYPMVAGGHAFYYQAGANLLVEGHGFIQPTDYFQEHWTVQAAEHPPPYILYLAIPSIVGPKSVLAHQLATCLLGVATVVLMGYAGRRIVGPKTGLAAAFLAAVYPNFWANDGLVLSETLAQLTIVIVILLAYRFWERRDRASALWLGVGLGLVICDGGAGSRAPGRGRDGLVVAAGSASDPAWPRCAGGTRAAGALHVGCSVGAADPGS